VRRSIELVNGTVQYCNADVKRYGTVSHMDRRQHYQSVAVELFTERGFNGVSMDEVVAAAGGSKATLYRYFPSKEALFEGIIGDLTQMTIAARPVDELGRLALDDALREIGRAAAQAALSERATVLFRLAVGEHNRFPALANVMFERGPAVTYERLRRFIEARAEAGEIEVDDAQIAAEQFLGGIVGHQQLRRALGQPTASVTGMEARVDAAIATFRAAYATRAVGAVTRP